MMDTLRHTHVRWDNFYRTWGAVLQLIMGAALVIVSIAVAIIAIALLSTSQATARLNREAVTLTVAACHRTREFGPYVAQDDARRHVFPPAVQRDYTRTIPPHC